MGRAALSEKDLHCRAHRRVPLVPSMLSKDQATGKVLRPTSGAFRPDRDEDGLSVYSQLLLGPGLGPADVAAAGRTASAVAGLREDVVTGLGLHFVSDPTDEEAIGHAHELIQGWAGLSVSAVRKRARDLANSALCTHPEGDWSDLIA